MRERYENALRILHDEICKMGIMVQRALSDAMAAIISSDTIAADAVVKADSQLDAAQYRIEDLCTMIIAREHPVAGDLRTVLAIHQVASELERMGDHAKGLAQHAGEIANSTLVLALPHLQNMLKTILGMLHAALEAFVDHDAKAALTVAEQDEEVDAYHDALYIHLMEALRNQEGNPSNIVTLLFLNRFLERLGDRVTNMCEWIYYAAKGERIEFNKGTRL